MFSGHKDHMMRLGSFYFLFLPALPPSLILLICQTPVSLLLIYLLFALYVIYTFGFLYKESHVMAQLVWQIYFTYHWGESIFYCAAGNCRLLVLSTFWAVRIFPHTVPSRRPEHWGAQRDFYPTCGSLPWPLLDPQDWPAASVSPGIYRCSWGLIPLRSSTVWFNFPPLLVSLTFLR